METLRELVELEQVRARLMHHVQFHVALEIQLFQFHQQNMVGSCSYAYNACDPLVKEYLVVVPS